MEQIKKKKKKLTHSLSDQTDKKKKTNRPNSFTKKDEKSTSRLPKQVQIQESTISEITYADEITKIVKYTNFNPKMYTFGEVRNPKEETIRTVENFMKQKISEMVQVKKKIKISSTSTLETKLHLLEKD
jgi:signal recognition particle subunit SEC65